MKNGSFRFISNSITSFEQGLLNIWNRNSQSELLNESWIMTHYDFSIPNCDRIRPFFTREVLFSILYE